MCEAAGKRHSMVGYLAVGELPLPGSSAITENRDKHKFAPIRRMHAYYVRTPTFVEAGTRGYTVEAGNAELPYHNREPPNRPANHLAQFIQGAITRRKRACSQNITELAESVWSLSQSNSSARLLVGGRVTICGLQFSSHRPKNCK